MGCCAGSFIAVWGKPPKQLMTNSWTGATEGMTEIGEMVGDGEEGVGAAHLLQRTIVQAVGAEAIVEDVEVASRRLGLVTESHRGQEILGIFQTQGQTRGPMHTLREWESRATVGVLSRWNPPTLGHQIVNGARFAAGEAH